MVEPSSGSDRYRRLDLLGEGGSGRVWLVEDPARPGKRLALKEALGTAPTDAAALRREFGTLSRFRHPGIVEAFDMDLSDEGHPRFTLDYVAGETLTETVGREGAGSCLELAAEALQVLAFLHDFDLIHRDVKPANLLVRRHRRLGRRLVLLDLGLAVSGDAEPEASERSGPVGTLPYLAPELFAGAPAGPRSDLYGLGAVLWEAVHGNPPFEPSSHDLTEFVELVREGRRAHPSPPPSYPEGFGPWLEELLAPDPGRRPSGAREALGRLNTACGTSFAIDDAVSRAARLATEPLPARKREFREIRSALDPTRGPRLIWLVGAAGTGKTCVLKWLRNHALTEGWDVFAVPGAPAPTSLLETLRDRATERPVLLLVDDVDTAPGGLAKVLERIAREGKAPPVQVVAAVRPGETHTPRVNKLLEDAATVPTMDRVILGPLDDEALRAMAERAAGAGAVSDARIRTLAAISERNALMAESLLVEGGWEQRRSARRPARIESSVQVRLGLLSEHSRAWVEALAVLGTDVSEEVVVELSNVPADEARAAAEEVRLAGLARVSQGRWSPDSRMIAGIVRDGIEELRRAELHLRAAEVLAARSETDADPWKLARLWSVAERADRAVESAMVAADRSLRDGAPEEAAERLAFALRHCPRSGPERLHLRRRQADALIAAGLFAAAARALGAALRLAREPDDRVDLYARQAHALVLAGRFQRARTVSADAIRLAADRFPAARARATLASGIAVARMGHEDEALPLFEAALAMSREQDEPAVEAEALHAVATCKARLRREGAEADFRQAIERYRSLGDTARELRSRIGLATVHTQLRQHERAGTILEEVLERASTSGHLDMLETSLSKLSSLALETGAYDRALVLGQEALDQARHLGDQNRLMVNRCRVAEASIGCGRPAEAAEMLREALAGAGDRVEPDIVDSARMLLAHALMEIPGADDEAIALPLSRSLDGFRRRRKTPPLLMALVIELERRALPGIHDPFEPAQMEFEALASGTGQEPDPEIRLRADLARGTWLLRRGNAAGARDEARSAARLADDADLPVHAARARALLGQSLDQLGMTEEAAEAYKTGTERLERAANRIESPSVRRTFLDRPTFRDLRSRTPAPSGENEQRLLALYDMIRALNSETDPDALLETILEMALRVVEAERGMILLRDAPDGEEFSVHVARNLEPETQKDALNYSRSIVAQAGAGRSILALDAGQDQRFRDLKSVSLFGIRSLICVPLRSRGQIIGTVYLDSRRAGRVITAHDLRFIEAFADHAALAFKNARERAELLVENRRLQTAAETRVRFGNIIGRSSGMQAVFDMIETIASSNLPVMIQGESGTGKELVARAVHFHGERKRKIFLTENCAAIPESLLESELFGHVRGAFTGAERDREGLFEQADKGTLFLDEIGDMSTAMQARLLRVLQEGELRRVGGNASIKVDVRVIAATHRDLPAEAAAGRFREDLLYRLQVLPIKVPPLRERPEDISPLVDYFLERISRERGREAPRIDSRVRAALERFAWPGNVRQLENTLQRMALLVGDGPILFDLIESDPEFHGMFLGDAREPAQSGGFSLRDAEREQLRKAIRAADGNREHAARLIGVSRATIYRKIRDLGLKEEF